MRTYQEKFGHENMVYQLVGNKNDLLDDSNKYLSEAKKFSLNCKPDKKLNFNLIYEKKPKKLKIGFVSGDLGSHSVGYFLFDLIKILQAKSIKTYANIGG